MRRGTKIVLALAGVALVVGSSRASAQPDESDADDGPRPPPPDEQDEPSSASEADVGSFAKPILVGKPSNPNVAALLAEMRAGWEAAGVNVQWFSPRELTIMKKAPGQESAIPPRNYWPRMQQTILVVAQPLRELIGVPCSLGGYRAPDYNKAVGGAPGSQHQAFRAIDMRPSSKLEQLKLAAARMWVENPSWSMGLGIYSRNIHVDFGWRRRTWERARDYIERVS